MSINQTSGEKDKNYSQFEQINSGEKDQNGSQFQQINSGEKDKNGSQFQPINRQKPSQRSSTFSQVNNLNEKEKNESCFQQNSSSSANNVAEVGASDNSVKNKYIQQNSTGKGNNILKFGCGDSSNANCQPNNPGGNVASGSPVHPPSQQNISNGNHISGTGSFANSSSNNYCQQNSQIQGNGHSFYGGNNYSTNNIGPSYKTTIGNVSGISNVGSTFNSQAHGNHNMVTGISYGC